MLGAATTAERTQIINYTHGIDVYDDDEDSNVTEKRNWVLGDTIHSVPLVVNYSPTDALILVGANDGMLHAFDDATGAEQWAYIPDALVSRLKLLTPGRERLASVLRRLVAEARDARRQPQDRRLRIRPRRPRVLRARRHHEDAPKFVWKLDSSSTGMSELGQAWSEPAFIKTSANVQAFLIGGGYDRTFDDPSHTAREHSAHGPCVFAINAETGALISKIQPTGMDFAIPSNVAALDFNGDGKVDRAYVGDLGGNMWRIDSALQATKLFASGGNRKIYYRPDVVRDKGFLSVFFGTGDRSNPLETTITDRMYGVKDDGTST
jgi:type IV pilus assembly protein PilY1